MVAGCCSKLLLCSALSPGRADAAGESVEGEALCEVADAAGGGAVEGVVEEIGEGTV